MRSHTADPSSTAAAENISAPKLASNIHSTHESSRPNEGVYMAQTNDPVGKLNELIRGIGVAVLTTVRPDGRLCSCPMAAHEADSNGVLWLISDNQTEKVEAVKTYQRVNLSFADHAAQRYVSVSGFCELVRDHAKTKELWNPSYKSWFPGGLDDPNLILLKIDVQHAEYWDPSANHMVVVAGFNKPPIE
jgi:general stress protein 26